MSSVIRSLRKGGRKARPTATTTGSSGDEVSFEFGGDGVEVVTGDEMHVIEMSGPTVSQEVEVVTAGSSVKTASMQLRQKGKRGVRNVVKTQSLINRGKTAPALLRNSRRFQRQETATSSNASMSGVERKSNSRKGGTELGVLNQSLHQEAILLDELGQPTNEIVVLAPNEHGDYSIVGRRTRSSTETHGSDAGVLNQHEEIEEANARDQTESQTIIICQDSDSNQFQHLIEDEGGNLVIPFQVEEGSGQIYLDESVYDTNNPSSCFFITSDSLTGRSQSKSKKKYVSKRNVQVQVVGPDGNLIKKKNQTELKCMEKGCLSVSYNIGELRKHLSMCHGFQFDEEVIHFSNEQEFKEWRETYERERMVSFIFRGGTKKVAKDQAVTYLICHRSGHYKPTMDDQTQRKRKMKPQGSCKMGGYCTAGIKLIKNTETGIVKMEICHTHYGHPLDSDAIPYLRVTSALRKVILAKFKAGLSFTEVLAYIHHNPDRLEGLRLVDRRAVRNIYDTWKHPNRRSKQVQKDIDELEKEDLETSIARARKEIYTGGAVTGHLDEGEKEDEQQPTPLTEPSTHQSLGNALTPLRPAMVLVGDGMDDQEAKGLAPSQAGSGKSSKSLRSRKIEQPEESSPKKKVKHQNKAQEPGKKEESEVTTPTNSKGSYGLRPNRKVEVYKQTKGRSTKKDATEEQCGKDTNIKQSKNTAVTSRGKKKPTKPKPTKVVEPHAEAPQPSEATSHPQFTVSDALEHSVEKLMNHGDSGPTVLLYKPLGCAVKVGGGGELKRDLRKDDVVLVLQTPVQRQLLLMFPNILGFDVIETSKDSEKHLQLAFLTVLDEFREPIPVAWLLATSFDYKVLCSFFKSLKRECGELRAKYMMTPRSSEAHKAWCSTFESKPGNLLSDIEVRRDLKQLVWNEFSTDKGRREVWEVVESLIFDRQAENLEIDNLEESFEPLFDKLPHSGEFMKKFEMDWLSRAQEWAYCHRFGVDVNLMGVSLAFNKLRKFIHFKGTKNLDVNFEQILKIGYDKCFLRSKRMFKGDQKLIKYLDSIMEHHSSGRRLKNTAASCTSVTEDSWLVHLSEKSHFIVTYVNSPCDCKLVCRACKICQHMYTCSCPDYLNLNIMCEHIHFTHTERYQITDDAEIITGDLDSDRPETSTSDDSHGTMINIEAVLKAAGLFHKPDGFQPEHIISITDADTQTIIYENAGGGSNDIILETQGPIHHEIQLVDASDLPDHEVITTEQDDDHN